MAKYQTGAHTIAGRASTPIYRLYTWLTPPASVGALFQRQGETDADGKKLFIICEGRGVQ